jgi:ankyrin repeat protein
LVAKWLRRQTLSSDEKAREDEEKKIADEGLTEMMVCAANGDLVRIRELVSYGVNVDDRSASGTTALMYAARNNHLAVVEFLLSSGADKFKKTDKNSTASDIARKHGHLEIAAFMEKYVGV